MFAAVGAMSHEHERAFSASLIYLGLGALAALAIQVLNVAAGSTRSTTRS